MYFCAFAALANLRGTNHVIIIIVITGAVDASATYDSPQLLPTPRPGRPSPELSFRAVKADAFPAEHRRQSDSDPGDQQPGWKHVLRGNRHGRSDQRIGVGYARRRHQRSSASRGSSNLIIIVAVAVVHCSVVITLVVTVLIRL